MITGGLKMALREIDRLSGPPRLMIARVIVALIIVGMTSLYVAPIAA